MLVTVFLEPSPHMAMGLVASERLSFSAILSIENGRYPLECDRRWMLPTAWDSRGQCTVRISTPPQPSLIVVSFTRTSTTASGLRASNHGLLLGLADVGELDDVGGVAVRLWSRF